MSILPQYRKFEDAEDDVPLLESSEGALPEVTVPTSYPPRAGPSSARKSHVRYIYEPRYPRLGDREEVLSVLGSGRPETVEIVQRTFPLLAGFEAERISFMTYGEANRNFIRISDEAWSTFDEDPPKTLYIQVADNPGDAEARRQHSHSQLQVTHLTLVPLGFTNNVRICLVIFGAIVVIGCVVVFLAWLSSGP
ncbi:hypothetical protein P7C73_g6654, partial [Tremellales sp. Uapishka_1]